MKFFPSKADTYVWMQPKVDGTSYQYIVVYVDDLLIAMEDLAELCKILKNKYGFQLKGDGLLMYHLGLDYVTDDHGTLCAMPKKYIDKMDMTYKQIFNESPKKYKTPLEKGDHPEIDESELMDEEGTTKYQLLIGQCQWLVTLGRVDVC